MKIPKLLSLILLFVATIIEAQTGAPNPSAQSPVPAGQTPEQYLRTLRHQGKNDLFSRDLRLLATKKDASLEVRAWYFSSISWLDLPRALAVLDGMRRDAPQDAWTLAARSYVTQDLEQSIALCEKAMAKNSSDDLLLFCTGGIAGQARAPDDAKVLKAFFDKHQDRYEASTDALVAESHALRGASPDDAEVLLDRVLKLDPHNLDVLFDKYYFLWGVKQQKKEAQAFLEAAASWASESPQWREYSGYADLAGNRELSKGERTRRLEADGQWLIEQGKPCDSGLMAGLVTQLYVVSAPKAAGELLDLAIQRDPGTDVADLALALKATARFDEDRNAGRANPDLLRDVANSLIEVYARPGTRPECTTQFVVDEFQRILGDGDESFTEQQFRAAKLLPDGHVFARTVVSRKAHLDEIEQLAKEKVFELLSTAPTRSAAWHYEVTRNDVAKYWSSLASWYDVLGYAYLQQGRLSEAEPQLEIAVKLMDVPIDPVRMPGETYLAADLETSVHAAKLYLAKGDYSKASQHLADALSAPYSGDDVHPAIAVYEELYLKQHGGNADGLDAYMADMLEKDFARRKPMVLKTRFVDLKHIEPFKLKTIDSQVISSDALKGKYLIINFWGTGCGPCKGEMPEVQKFYEKYKGNPKVRFLSFAADETVEPVAKYITEKKFTFPVLMAGGYALKVGMVAYPTTWFVDPEGRKQFEVSGGTKRLVEEFSWRLEAMMESDAPAETAAAQPRKQQ